MQMTINCYPTIHIIAIVENKMYGILESSSQIKMLGQVASDGD